MKKSASIKSVSDEGTLFTLSHIHNLAWINIALQVAFPLALSFTPALAELSAPSVIMNLRGEKLKTIKYRLKAGESVWTIANRYSLSVQALEKLNHDRHFAHGFQSVTQGDEISVPENLPTDDDLVARNLASAASQTGSFLANHPNSDAAAAMVKGMAVGKANQAVQEWMNQFGTAQVQIGLDEHLSLKDSSLSLLHSWYDTPTSLVFSQTDIHRTDNRTQTNLGAGYRHFREYDMLGLNAFVDYDLSRDHARAGVGAEYWRDNLKLGANAYLHLSGWKNSPDAEDYYERPANGWDIRAEGYLPAYPQLGAKLMYEQYYGDEVALFGKENRQKNPRAVTVGLNWTPVPLLTVGAEQRTGEDGKHETQISAELNWRMGESLSRQLDTGAVAAARSLAGSRYDLVERNNNIILEYRKQEVIRLRMPERLEGRGHQVMPLTLSVKAKHGLKDIEWDTAALTAAGGKLIGKGTQWQLTLPAWKAGEVNAWQISAVAHDMKGNSSNLAEMQVVVTEPQVSADKSTLAVDDVRLLADGKAKTDISIILRDDAGLPLTRLAKQIKLNGVLTPDKHLVEGVVVNNRAVAAVQQPVLSAVTETSAGHYHATLTAGTTAGGFKLNAKILDTALTPVMVIFEDTHAVMKNSTLTSDKTVLAADGRDKTTLTLSLYDSENKPVSDEEDRLTFYVKNGSLPLHAYTFGKVQVQKGKPGQYTVTFSGTQPATHLALGVKINGNDSDKHVDVDLIANISVTINGNPVVGEELRAVAVCDSACSTLKYQWIIEDKAGSGKYVPVTGATLATYRPVRGDQKRRIEVTVNE